MRAPGEIRGRRHASGVGIVCFLTVLACCGVSDAAAQAYPSKPVRIVVGFAAGGSIDIVARRLAPKLSEALGQQFIVDNRAGAGSVIGTDYVAKSAADGYTLLLSGVTGLAAGASVFRKLPYDTRRDFAPIVLVLQNPGVLLVHPSVPARSVREFLALLKSRPGRLNYASSGAGGGQHLAAELLIMITGIDMVHVPYKGGAPALVDLVAGQVDIMIDTIPSAATQYVEAGKLRALAVTSPRRTSALPDVPTMIEAGLTNYEFRTWMGLAAPARTPKEILARLNAATNAALAGGDFRAWLDGLGVEVAGGTPERFQAFLESEIDLYARIVKASGMPLL
jgi:tripartite-type tricarboxylate transporter receptor subunit TctC